MAKYDQKKEKIAKNELYAKKHRKRENDDSQGRREIKENGGLWGRWCRTKDHPRTCNCTYPNLD